jgi:AhpD family alkylhydroperoxidase
VKPRIEFHKIGQKPIQLMLAIEGYLNGCGLDHGMLHLIKLRASQINGCAYCIDMHSKDARAAGESEQRLYALNAWEETPFFSERERAALQWTEALTLVADGHVPDAVFEAVRPHFTDDELVNLSLAISTINAWNRLSIAFRSVPGAYQPPVRKAG